MEPSHLPIGPIEDPRVRFYLDNRGIIETWAALRKTANDVLKDLLLELVDVLAADALHLGNDIEVGAEAQSERRPRIAVVRRSWRDPRGQAPAAVVVEWYRQLLNEEGLWLYVGVRLGDRGRRDQKMKAHLEASAPRLRRALGPGWKDLHDDFPVWRWIGAREEDRIDELSILQETRTAVWECWNAARSEIDAALLAGEGPPQSI
jgi:hypothetical protein